MTLAGEVPQPAAAEPRVVRRDRITLTQSCCEALEGAIGLGSYRPGARLPSEAELAEQLAVSRPTLREALRLLEERGLIYRRHGRGTFVRERPIQKELNRNFGITSMIRAAGYTPSAREGRVEMAQASAEIAEHLGLAVGDPVWRIQRVRLADQRPVVFSTDSVAGDLVGRDDLAGVASGKALERLFTPCSTGYGGWPSPVARRSSSHAKPARSSTLCWG